MHKGKMSQSQARNMMKKAAKEAKRIQKPGEKYQQAVKRAYKKMKKS